MPAIILNGKLPVPPGKVESLLQVLKCFDVFIVTYPEYEALARALAVNASRICIAPEPSRYVINTTTTRRLHFTPISEVLKFLRQCSVPDTEFDAWSTDGGVRELHPGATNQWITLHAALRGSFSRELRATGRPYIARARLDKPPLSQLTSIAPDHPAIGHLLETNVVYADSDRVFAAQSGTFLHVMDAFLPDLLFHYLRQPSGAPRKPTDVELKSHRARLNDSLNITRVSKGKAPRGCRHSSTAWGVTDRLKNEDAFAYHVTMSQTPSYDAIRCVPGWWLA